MNKRRIEANVAQVMNVIGDVRSRTCLIVDDIIDTAGTLVKAADALAKDGATKVYACCSHPVLSGPAVESIQSFDMVEVVVKNTIPLHSEARKRRKPRGCCRPEGSAEGAPFRSRTERDFEALHCRSWLLECNSKELASGSGQRELLTCGFLPDRDGCCDPRDSAHPRCRGSTRRESRCWNPRIGHPGNRSRMLTG